MRTVGCGPPFNSAGRIQSGNEQRPGYARAEKCLHWHCDPIVGRSEIAPGWPEHGPYSRLGPDHDNEPLGIARSENVRRISSVAAVTVTCSEIPPISIETRVVWLADAEFQAISRRRLESRRDCSRQSGRDERDRSLPRSKPDIVSLDSK